MPPGHAAGGGERMPDIAYPETASRHHCCRVGLYVTAHRVAEALKRQQKAGTRVRDDGMNKVTKQQTEELRRLAEQRCRASPQRPRSAASR